MQSIGNLKEHSGHGTISSSVLGPEGGLKEKDDSGSLSMTPENSTGPASRQEEACTGK